MPMWLRQEIQAVLRKSHGAVRGGKEVPIISVYWTVCGTVCSELLVTSGRIQRFPARGQTNCLSQSRTITDAYGTALEIQAF